MEIRVIQCVPRMIDTEQNMIVVEELDVHKDQAYNVYEKEKLLGFKEFLGVKVTATLYDDKIAEMKPIDQAPFTTPVGGGAQTQFTTPVGGGAQTPFTTPVGGGAQTPFNPQDSNVP